MAVLLTSCGQRYPDEHYSCDCVLLVDVSWLGPGSEGEGERGSGELTASVATSQVGNHLLGSATPAHQ